MCGKIKVRTAVHHRRQSVYSVRTPKPARRLNFQMDITSREVKFEARRQGRAVPTPSVKARECKTDLGGGMFRVCHDDVKCITNAS